MTARFATAEDFANWESRAKTMTDTELHYASRDCFSTASNWRNVDSVAEGFYKDQGCTYSDELRKRAKGSK